MTQIASDRTPRRAGTPAGAHADELNAVMALSDEALGDDLAGLFAQMAAVQGKIVVRVGEVERRRSYEEEGASSTAAWVAGRFGVSSATARAYARVAEKATELPQLLGSLCAGEVSLDKVRTVAHVATARSDRALCAQAKALSVRELAEVARSATTPSAHEERRYLRCNDTFRTMTLRLGAPEYAETKAALEARAKQIPSDGQTPWDQRLADAHLEVIRSSVSGSPGPGAPSPYVVVAHVPLAALVEEGEGEGDGTELAAELEGGGLIDVATLQRLACDATLVVAVDDDVGHTMYEGRAQRFPTEAQRREVVRRDRHCRFPGCDAKTFTNVHHIVPWKPGGTTDLDNLVLVCNRHHGVVHRNAWSMTGDANTELTIVGPSGRVMTSRPSPLWTRVTARPEAGTSD